MTSGCGFIPALIAILALGNAHAGTSPADRIFKSAFMETFVIEGKAGYPGPLANARVEAHFGNLVAHARTQGDGTYRVGIEIDQLDPDAIVEVIARGSGAESHLVWTGPLGPESRLIDLAGPDHVIGFAEEPMTRLSPRSTALAGAIRAFNDWQPVSDAATFYRAARARQIRTDDLMFGLATIARGGMPLPDGVADTFAAVSSLEASQGLLRAEQNLAMTSDCSKAPNLPYCVVKSTFALDTEIFPLLTWTDGRLYSRVLAYSSVSGPVEAFLPNGNTIEVLPATGESVPGLVTPLADGGYEIVSANGEPLYSIIQYPFVGNQQVYSLYLVTKYYVRLVRGPGGQTGLGFSMEFHTTYPDNPEIPEEDIPYYRPVLPRLSGGDPLPPEVLADVPNLTNQQVVMPSPIPRPSDLIDGGYGYDTHAFGTTSGTAERSGEDFTFSQSGDGILLLDSAGAHAEIRFVNEEEPGVWRIQMHVSGADGTNVVDALLLTPDAEDFTPGNVLGNYRSRLHGEYCAGPFADLALPPKEGEYSFSICDPPFTFTFNDDGTVLLTSYFSTDPWGTWSLPGSEDIGRLLFHTVNESDPSYIYQRRGWEAVHVAEDHLWVLENYAHDTEGTGPPPIAFTPTRRLVRYQQQ